MSYFAQRNHRFYIVDYAGYDPLSGTERRRWHPAGTSRTEAVAIRDRIDAARPPATCPAATNNRSQWRQERRYVRRLAPRRMM
jgi:hypothetical protein